MAFALSLNFEPDAVQRAVLESAAHRGILNCCRQWGKSTLTALIALERAASRPGSEILVVTPSNRQSGEFIRKVESLAARAGYRARGDGYNSVSLMLPNGSRIVGLPCREATVRGFSAVSLLIFDEAAQVPEYMYKALRPMLAVANGDLWLLSTPFGKQGFFYEKWAFGGAEWSRFQVKATECARIAESFLEEERGELGNAYFQQEYMCEFVDNGGQLFARDLVEGALEDVGPLMDTGHGPLMDTGH